MVHTSPYLSKSPTWAICISLRIPISEPHRREYSPRMAPLRWIFISLVLSTLLSSGCRRRPRVEYVPIRQGFIPRQDVTITGNGGFRLAGGEVFRPPYQTDCSDLNNPPRRAPSLREAFEDAQRMGARRVQVQIGTMTYYGVLALCEAPDDATGPASRSYEMQLRDDLIAQAAGGRVVVLYETMQHRRRQTYGWVLWLSDRPF